MEIGHYESDESPDEIMRLQRIERARQRPGSPHHRIPRDNSPPDGPNSKNEWFKKGHLLSSDDEVVSPLNLGLGPRERAEIARENQRAWGMDWPIVDSIRNRVNEVVRRLNGKPERSGTDSYKMHPPWDRE
jgi:hypothetical protein